MSRRSKCMIIGLVAGLLSGMFGLGGGVILVPAMTAWLAVPQHTAHATSLAVIIPTAVLGSIIYGMNGNLDLTVAIYLAAGSSCGAILGAKLMKKMSAGQLQTVFGLLLIIVGIRMVIA